LASKNGKELSLSRAERRIVKWMCGVKLTDRKLEKEAVWYCTVAMAR